MLRFTVAGEPATQGSMTAVYNRRLKLSAVRHSNAPALGIWRTDVAVAAKNAGATLIEGPVAVHVTFGMKAPMITKHGYPKKGDLDKLVRAILDALTHVCYENDNQVCEIVARKVWDYQTEIEVMKLARRQIVKSSQTEIWAQDAEWLAKD